MSQVSFGTRPKDLAVTLLASAARTETDDGSNQTEVKPPNYVHGFAFLLDVTAAATAAGDTLDVFVQTRIGSVWMDVVEFTQVTGTSGATKEVDKLVANIDEAGFDPDTALTGGSVTERHIIGDAFRVRWDINDATTDDASFTFSVTMIPL